jgi:hypothetical protein
MKITSPERGSPALPGHATGLRDRLAGAGRRASGALTLVGRTATMLIVRVPGTVHATQATARGTTSTLQTLPDSTLRWLAASSVGLGAGFYLSGAPRLVTAAGVAPALLLGAAIVLRPSEPVVTW